MRRLLLLPLLLLAGCGATERAAAPRPAATPSDYYAGVTDAPAGDVEAEYHQPPKPARTTLGRPITLTGVNIGVRMRVQPTAVERRGDLLAVRLRMRNTGIAVYEGELHEAALTYADGAQRRATRTCGAPGLRVDVGDTWRGCLLFPAEGRPERLQLALETVPVAAGGIWELG